MLCKMDFCFSERGIISFFVIDANVSRKVIILGK